MNNNNSESIDPNNNNIASVANSNTRRNTRITSKPALYSDEQSNYQNVSQYNNYPPAFYDNDEYDDEIESDFEVPDISSESDEKEQFQAASVLSTISSQQQQQ
jgi:hypothetical protein